MAEIIEEAANRCAELFPISLGVRAWDFRQIIAKAVNDVLLREAHKIKAEDTPA